MRIAGFGWDDVNTHKLEAHDLGPDDVESLFEGGEAVFFQHPSRKHRFIALGFVPDGRFVLVVFELDLETSWARVVTAYETESQKWWKVYARSRRD